MNIRKNMFFVFCTVLCLNFILVTPLHAGEVNPTLRQVIELTYNAQFAEAQTSLNAYITANPQDPMGYLVRGTSLDWEQIIRDLRGKHNNQIIEDYKHANSIAFLEWEKDEGNIDKMITLGNTYLYLARKWINLKKKSRAGLILKKCKKHMEEAISKDPNRYDAYLAIGAFNYFSANIPAGFKFIASLLGISGDEKIGIQQISQTANHPNLYQVDAQYLLVYIYGDSKKDFDQTKKYLNELIAKYPNNTHFRYLLGYYGYKTKKYVESRSLYDEFLNYCEANQGACVNKYYFETHYYLAAGYFNEKNYELAKTHLDKAVPFDTKQNKEETAYLHYYRGMILKSEGKTAEAKNELSSVQTIVTTKDEVYQKAQKELESLSR